MPHEIIQCNLILCHSRKYNSVFFIVAVRSAYMKAAIKYHPDKQEEKDREDATKKFQIVQKIYELFKDSELRKIYDQTGL